MGRKTHVREHPRRTRSGRVTDVTDHDRTLKEMARPQKLEPRRKSRPAPYASDVRFFADRNKKSIIYVRKAHTGKGWFDLTVGSHTLKTRGPESDLYRLLKRYYPSYEPISLFSETSFHSSFTQGSAGKITHYGLKDYNLQYSTYEPMGIYKLERPVRTNSVSDYGRVIDSVTLQKWNYMVLNWIPRKDGIELKIQHKESTPFEGEERVIYESEPYSLEERGKAIADFQEYVAKHG